MTAPRFGIPLSGREQALLELMSEGLTFHLAGKALNPPADERTARRTLANAYVKLGAENLPHAILLACRAGVLDGRPRRHGDHAGYAAHARAEEEPCDACVEGERAYRAEQRRARRAAKAA
ncbi:hypothetical protein ABZ508_26585 [Streptomyces lavendulocolor]|uniref:HTH luxR-type domain-containing protein n=1 Tax=Streptomyces lavendulocolor TaxID=67316 RepID=A0ABV2WC34_9ACTN